MIDKAIPSYTFMNGKNFTINAKIFQMIFYCEIGYKHIKSSYCDGI